MFPYKQVPVSVGDEVAFKTPDVSVSEFIEPGKPYTVIHRTPYGVSVKSDKENTVHIVYDSWRRQGCQVVSGRTEGDEA